MPSSTGISNFTVNDSMIAFEIAHFVYNPFCLPLNDFGFDAEHFPMRSEEQNKTRPGFEKLVPSNVELSTHSKAARAFDVRPFMTMTMDATPTILFTLMVNNLILAENPYINFSSRGSRLLVIPHVSSLVTRDHMPFRFSTADMTQRKAFFRNVRPNETLFPNFPTALQSLSFDDFVARYLPLIWMDLAPVTRARAMDAFKAWKAYYAHEPLVGSASAGIEILDSASPSSILESL